MYTPEYQISQISVQYLDDTAYLRAGKICTT